MFYSFLEWLGGLGPAAGSFVGTVTGWFLGLLALVGGALFNAHLNRRRDDRLRQVERRSVAVALKAELVGFRRQLVTNAEGLKSNKADFLAPCMSDYIKIMPQVLSKIGLLDVECIHDTVKAYALMEEHEGRLLLMGGKASNDVGIGQRLILMPVNRSEYVAGMNMSMVKSLDVAIERLDKEIQASGKAPKA